jgi:hypothetical protein
MLASLLIAASIAASGGKQIDVVDYLDSGTGRERFAYVQVIGDPMDPPKLSPRKYPPLNEKWEFPWLTSGFVQADGGQYMLRFRVFSQDRKPDDVASKVARMSLRLWEQLVIQLGSDHQPVQKGRNFVDIYLAWGGEAGGEQAFTEDVEFDSISKRPFVTKANAITIYDIKSFKKPVEMARELAHEYGHATIPAVGGFGTPEDWGNGYLGEKLYMRWLRDAMVDGTVSSDDVMGAKVTEVDQWVGENVTPLVIEAASRPPDLKLLDGKGKKAMDAYLGLVLYADSILPQQTFARSIRLIGSDKAGDYPNAMVLAVAEKSFDIDMPMALRGRAFWFPLGNARVKNAKVLEKSGTWVKLQAIANPVQIVAPGEATGG